MNVEAPSPLVPPARVAAVRLAELAYECLAARCPSRELDARIAMAVFPMLRDLVTPATGVWIHPDGRRVRALRYSSSRNAASTLVPLGHWIEEIGPRHTISVHSHRLSRRPTTATHPIAALAVTAAALRARAQNLTPEN